MSPERASIAWRGAPVQRAAAAGVEPSTAVYNIMLKELRLEGDGDGFARLKVVGLRRPVPRAPNSAQPSHSCACGRGRERVTLVGLRARAAPRAAQSAFGLSPAVAVPSAAAAAAARGCGG
jgi:hypothetical protein